MVVFVLGVWVCVCLGVLVRGVPAQLLGGKVMRWDLDDRQVDDLFRALRIAREVCEGHALEMESLAARLRAGEEFGWFAPGEDGARAADRLARGHRDSVELFEALGVELEECCEEQG